MTLVPPLHHSLPTRTHQPPPSMSHHTSRSPVGSLVVETCLPLSMLNITHPLVPHIVCDLHHTEWSSTFPPVVTVSIKTTTTPTSTTEKVCKVLNTPHTWHHAHSSKVTHDFHEQKTSRMMTHQGKHMTRWQASWLHKGMTRVPLVIHVVIVMTWAWLTRWIIMSGDCVLLVTRRMHQLSRQLDHAFDRTVRDTVHDESLYSAVTHGPRASLGWLAEGNDYTYFPWKP